MEAFLFKLLISSVVVIITAWVSPGVHIRGFGSAILVALVLSLLNIFLRPLMLILSLPATILTFGLFVFIINAFIVWLTSKIVSGFKIDSFGWALVFSLILSIVTYIFDSNEIASFF